ncbi:MAG TPA: hypothetical protein VFX16_07915 [Pseudonocardiaceae bacterium]|nr:hypothetical protein [Pseudonocardiaceae bacterium]
MAMSRTGRRTFLKGLGATAAAAFAVPILESCAGGTSTSVGANPSTGSGKPVKGGSATLAIEDNPVNMDPADGQLYSSLQVYQNIFSELLEVDTNFNFKPNLAASWQQEDEKTWIFHRQLPVDTAVAGIQAVRHQQQFQQPLPEVAPTRRRRKLVRIPPHALLDGLREQAVPGGEVPKHGAPVDAGRFGHVVHGRREATLRQHDPRGPQDSGPRHIALLVRERRRLPRVTHE